MVRIWIDCDPGHDDAFALLLAAHYQGAELIGVSAVHGNASLRHTFDNTSSVLIALNRLDVPIYKGADKPLTKQCTVAENIHGISGIDGTALLPKAWDQGCDNHKGTLHDMATALAKHRDVHLCATGPMTNVAKLTQLYPQIMRDSVSQLIIMGGALKEAGNVTPEAEFNTWCCPDSLQQVLDADCWSGKIVLCPLDLTHQAILSDEVISHMRERCRDSKFSQMWIELGTFFSNTYKQVFGFMHGGPVHDPTTVAWCLDKSVCRGQEVWLEVDCSDGPTRGKTRFMQDCGKKNILVLDTLDAPRFWEMILVAMEQANIDTPVNK